MGHSVCCTSVGLPSDILLALGGLDNVYGFQNRHLIEWRVMLLLQTHVGSYVRVLRGENPHCFLCEGGFPVTREPLRSFSV